MKRAHVTTALEVIAAALIVASVVLIYWRAAPFVAGLAVLAVSYSLTQSEPADPKPETEAPA